MIKARRGETEIQVELNGINAIVQMNVPSGLMEICQPYIESLERGIRWHLEADYYPDREDAAATYLESQGWKIIEKSPPINYDDYPDDVVF
jgi:hypothetical protein